MEGLLAIAAIVLFVACKGDIYDTYVSTVESSIVQNYENAFLTRFGQPAPNQDWGFSDNVAGVRGSTRSQASPEVPHLQRPISEADITAYMETAKDPTSANVNDNHDDSYYVEPKEGQFVKTHEEFVVDVPAHEETYTETVYVEAKDWGWGWAGKGNTLFYNYNQWSESWTGITQADKDFWDTYCAPYNNNNWAFYGTDNKIAATTKLMEYLTNNGRRDWANVWQEGSVGGYQEVPRSRWVDAQGHMEDRGYYIDAVEGGWVYDENFVKNFKISQGTSWMGNIPVLASEDELARTIYVKGTWNVTANQSVGSRGNGLVVICDGGTINVSSGVTMTFDNQARLVVLPGGRLRGDGSVVLANGTAEGLEAYNGGIIDVNMFDNNYGKVFNYGTFKPQIYAARSTRSNFYNHGIVHIRTMKVDGSYLTPNARIFNACQWYCEEDMNFRNLEMTSGSSLIVGGELKAELSGDGTDDPSYAALGAGALVKCGTLYNNLTSWTGPTSGGYAVLSIGEVTYLNWSSDGNVVTSGYIENNIYIQADNLYNNPEGNNYWREGVTMNAGWKLKYILANGLDGNPNSTGRGNGNTRLIFKGTTEIIAADPEGFTLGVKGCSPGFMGDMTDVDIPVSDTGDSGDSGDTGDTGDTGNTGDSGDSGDTGDSGNTGNHDAVQYNGICRICVEDLSVASDNNDFDFNDVVFDVCPNDDGQTTTLVIRAIGGELPLYIEEQEVHLAVFNKTNKEMMNVGRDGAIDFNKVCGTIVIQKYIASRADARNIDMYVKRSTGDFKLNADRGEVPSKICVGTDYEWCSETQDIDWKYYLSGVKLFEQYVQGNYANDVWYRALYEARQ